MLESPLRLLEKTPKRAPETLEETITLSPRMGSPGERVAGGQNPPVLDVFSISHLEFCSRVPTSVVETLLFFTVPVPVPTFDKFRFRFRLLTS